MKKVLIIMGSKSDLVIMQEAENLIKSFELGCDMIVASAHRTPEKVAEIAKNAYLNYQVVIAGAGKAAHLPGVVASFTTLPVIGVPIKTSDLGGLDSLLSIVQMPKGVPVATVAINGSQNAAILAIQIMALGDEAINERLKKYKNELA